MIVTRRRKKRFPWKRTLIPAAAVAVIAFALWWSPSREFIASNPVTGPLWNAPVWKPIAKPFDAAAQQGTISAQTAQINELARQLADAQTQIAARDKQISQLQTQLNQSQQDAAVSHASKPAGTVVPNTTAPGADVVTADLTQSGTADMRRTAQVWSAMDSEAAAKVVQRLPDAYVARIFALMPPDSVGAILENLPAGYAARLTQEHPELKR